MNFNCRGENLACHHTHHVSAVEVPVLPFWCIRAELEVCVSGRIQLQVTVLASCSWLGRTGWSCYWVLQCSLAEMGDQFEQTVGCASTPLDWVYISFSAGMSFNIFWGIGKRCVPYKVCPKAVGTQVIFHQLDEIQIKCCFWEIRGAEEWHKGSPLWEYGISGNCQFILCPTHWFPLPPRQNPEGSSELKEQQFRYRMQKQERWVLWVELYSRSLRFS